MATLITLVDGTIPVAADFNSNFAALNTELRPATTGGTGQSTYAPGDLLYASASNTLSRLAAGGTNATLTMAAGTSGAQVLPTWNGAVGAPPLSAVYGLQAANNAVAPTSKYDMFAAAVRLWNPTTGGLRTVIATTLTNDIAAATTVNGRDQVAAFTNSTWVYFYFVGTGFGVPTTLSSASPSVPAFLTGQNECALAGAVFINPAGPKLQVTAMRGSWVYYSPPVTLLGPGSTTTETSVSLASAVPPGAVNLLVRAQTNNASAGGTLTSRLRIISGADYYIQTVTATDQDSAAVQLPNLNQQVFFINDPGSAGGSTFFVECIGYQTLNGG